jgi:ABC-type antimicrobial peptide transport system permease subunit
MLKHLIISFYRQIKFNKTLHALNFLVLTLGFVILLFIFFFLRNEFKYEYFQKNKDSIFRVITLNNISSARDKTPFTPPALGPALKEGFPQIKEVTRYSLENRELLKTENYSNVFQVALCDKSFFDIFSFELIKGSLEQFNHKSEVIIITENTSKKLFGNENPIGKRIKSGYSLNYLVIGVIKDYSKLTHIQFDALTPFTGFHNLNQWNTYQNYQTYVLLNKNAHFDKNNLRKLRYFLKDYIKNYQLLEYQSINDIHLNSDFDDPWVTNKGDKRLIYLLISASIILISVMLFNYFNLTTSLYISRTKEFSIKKVLGLHSDKILYEHIIENIFFILSSVCASLLVFYFVISFTKSINFDINLQNQAKSIFFISIFFIGIMLLPAIITHFLSKINVSGFSLSSSANSGINPKYRIFGMALQILISVVIIFFAIVISNQLIYIKNKELGYDYKNIVYTPIYSWRYSTEKVREILLKNPNIISASAVSDLPINLTFKRKLTDWDGKITDEDTYVYLAFTDVGFTETFNIQLIDGAFFSKDFTFNNYFKTDASKYYVVNQAAVEQMNLKNPLNTKFNCNGFTGEIIGVVKNFHFRSLQKKIEPLFIQFNPESWLYLFVKLKINDKNTLDYIKSTIEKFENKGYPIEFKFLEDDFNNLYGQLRRMAYSTIVFAVTAFILSIIGLIAVISFLEKKKQKEFAIKKIFGAQSNRIIRDFILELSLYIVPSILISVVIGYYGTKKWLQGFVYQASYPYLQLALAIALIYFLIIILVYFKVRKTTNINPSKVLKYE